MDVFKNKKMQLIENQNFKKMKTSILSIAILFAVSFGLTESTNAASKNNVVVTILGDISNVNKIEVHGNVELYISDGNTNNVKVYNQYYGESALVQNHNGVLRISSYKAEKLIVWVTANDLRSVSAYDNAEVKSFGNLSKIEFNVELHNNAKATLDLDTYSANISVADNAHVNLSGNAKVYNLTRSIGSTIVNNNFKADHFTEAKVSIPAAKNEDDVVEL